MARCSDCNKFVSYDAEVEPELDNEDVTGTHLTANVRRVLGCAECGNELKSFDFEIDTDFADQLEEGQQECIENTDGEETKHDSHDWEIDISLTATTGGKGRKTEYGYEGQVTLTCNQCSCTVEFPVSGEESSSSFEEC